MNTDTLGGIRAWLSWLLAVAFVMMVFALQTGYAITNPYVAESLSMSLTQVGIVGSIYTWVFAISQFASGSILDRFGARVIPIACTLVALGAFTFANATNVYVLILAQTITAVGASFGFIGAGFIGGLWFEPMKYGLMFALVQFGASMSAVFNQQILNALIEQVNWSVLINGIAIITLSIAALQYVLLRDPIQVLNARKETTTWNGLRAFLHDITVALNDVASISSAWINCLIGGVTFGTMLALGVVWGPRFLVEMGLDQNTANIASSMSWLGLAFGSPLFAWLSDLTKSRKKPMFAACFAQLIVIVVLLSSSTLNFMSSASIFFLWGLMAGGSMIPFSVAADLVKPALIGTSAALVNATQFIIGGILMAIPGRVLSGEGFIARLAHEVSGDATQNLSDFSWALIIYPIVLMMALVLFLFLSETYPDANTDKE